MTDSKGSEGSGGDITAGQVKPDTLAVLALATGTVAANLTELEAELVGCDDGVLRHLCPGHDFSRWAADVFHDRPFAASLAAGFGPVLCGEPGDMLVIEGEHVSGLPRTGTIIAAAGREGRPPFLVRWTAGDYESRIIPGSGARVEKHHA